MINFWIVFIFVNRMFLNDWFEWIGAQMLCYCRMLCWDVCLLCIDFLSLPARLEFALNIKPNECRKNTHIMCGSVLIAKERHKNRFRLNISRDNYVLGLHTNGCVHKNSPQLSSILNTGLVQYWLLTHPLFSSKLSFYVKYSVWCSIQWINENGIN